MSNVSVNDVALIAATMTVILFLGVMTFLYIKQNLTKSLAGKFLLILAIGLFSSLFPLGPISMMFGFPAVLISSSIITLIFRKELR